MGLHKKDLQYYENKHNLKFPDELIKVTKRIGQYIYFETEFGECRMHIGNVGKATYSMQSATNKTNYLINRLYKLHGDIYNYSLVNYKNKTNEKVTLICKKHGNFEKNINTLITNKNVYCPHCYNESIRGLNRVSSKEVFIEKANAVHNFKYDYSILIYTTAKQEVEIICPTHGKFIQTADSHLSGYGCKKCANIITSNFIKCNPTGWSLINWKRAGEKSKNFDSFKVYIIKCWNDGEKFYKIGRTYLKVERRFIGKYNMPYKYEIINIYKGNAKDVFNLEIYLKRENKNNKYIPKLKFNGMYECFTQINYERTI